MAAVVANEESLVVVEPREGALDDPADAAEAGAVTALAAGDLCADAALPQLAAVLVLVLTAVSGQALPPSSRPSDLAAHWRNAPRVRNQLASVNASAADRLLGEWGP